MSYYYNFDPSEADISEIMNFTSGIMSIVIAFVLWIAVVAWLFFFIFRALGLYGTAKTCGIANPWLAFVPVGQDYILGKVAEYDLSGKKPMRYGIIMLVLGALDFAYSIFTYSFLATFCTSFLKQLGVFIEKMQSGGTDNDVFNFVSGLLGSLMPLIIIGIFGAFASLAYLVFVYISEYRLYKTFYPDNAVVYTVLAVIFPFIAPFFVFSMRSRSIAGVRARDNGAL